MLRSESSPVVLRQRFRRVHGLIDAALERSIGEAAAHYAVKLVYEDVIVNGVLDAQTPLAYSGWRKRTGLSELPPLVGQRERRAWTRRVHVDASGLRAYAQAVYAATDAFLARLGEPSPGEPMTCLLTGLLLRLSTPCTGFAPLHTGQAFIHSRAIPVG
jgi:hypothetical protein